MECTNIVSNRRAVNGSYENTYQKLKETLNSNLIFCEVL